MCSEKQIIDPVEKEKESISREKVKKMRIIDNLMFQYCAKDNPEFVEHILNPILVASNQNPVKLESVQIEDVLPNAAGRGVRLDCKAITPDGKYYLVEMQTETDNKELVYRVRFYKASVDVTLLRKGDRIFSEMPDVEIVFVCEGNPRPNGVPKAIYESIEIWKDTGEPVENGLSAIYVNGKWKENDLIGNLNIDIQAIDAENVMDDVLRNTFKQFKPGGERVSEMYIAVENFFTKDEISRIEDAGVEKGKLGSIYQLMYKNMKDKEIASLFCMKLNEVQAIRKTFKNNKTSIIETYKLKGGDTP